MGILSRFRRRKNPYAAVTEEEQIARYVYLLNTLPASVIESAHAAAFKDLSAAQRREMFEQLRPFMSDAERTASADDPHVLAKLVRRAEERRAARAAAEGGPDAEAEASVAHDDRDRGPATSWTRATMMMQTGVMALVAYQFLLTSSVSAYFTVGAGSLDHRRPAGLGGRHVRPRARRAASTPPVPAATTAAAVRRRRLRRRLRRRRFRGRLRRRRRRLRLHARTPPSMSEAAPNLD